MLLAKVTFTFSPDVILSPLALPKHILHRYVNDLLAEIKPTSTPLQQPLIDVLEHLLTRKTMQEEWAGTFESGLSKGKNRVIQLEKIRNDTFTMNDILKQDGEIYEWWQQIN